MSIINEKVLHRTFGEGAVTAVADGRISVSFALCGCKTFQYPASFTQYLSMAEAGAQQEVNQDLEAWQAQEDRDKNAQQQHCRDQISEMLQNSTKAKPKKAAPRRTTLTTAKTKKAPAKKASKRKIAVVETALPE